jgi:hypothetical protein
MNRGLPLEAAAQEANRTVRPHFMA